MASIFVQYNDESLSWLVSGGLFLSTTILYLLQRQTTVTKKHQQSIPHDDYPPTHSFTHNDDINGTVIPIHDRDDKQQDRNDENDDKFNMEWYRLRRMEDRMSFREVNSCQQDHLYLPYPLQNQPIMNQTSPKATTTTITTELPSSSRDTYSTTDNDVFHQDTRRRRSSEIVVQNNWNHFEGYHSDDDTRQPPPPPLLSDTIVDQQQPQPQRTSKNVQHVDEIHPMIKSSNIFREISIGSDNGEEEALSKLLEGEDLPDQELYCGYPTPILNQKQNKITSPSITPPPPFRSSTSSTDEESIQQQQHHHSTQPPLLMKSMIITRPVPRIANSSIPNHIRRARSVPDPTLETNDTLDPQQQQQPTATTNHYIASNRTARAKYNASIMPNKLILIRHGQSLGNVDEKLYATTPDNAMPLTELGWEQAKAAGQQLKQLLTSSTTVNPIAIHNNNHDCCGTATSTVHFIVSPYVRTVETFHGIVSAWCDPTEFDHIDNYEQRLNAWYSRLMEYGLTWAEDPRIREQDFGNYQEPKMIQQAKRDRHMFGAFYYRFPLGESASDVFDRVSTFLDSLWRSFDTNHSRNYVLVTHGISIRVILARYFRYTIDQFHQLANPRNCEMVVLQHDGAGRLILGGRYELESKKSEDDVTDYCNTSNKNPTVVEYTFHPRLRVLPQKYAHKAKVRMKYGD